MTHHGKFIIQDSIMHTAGFLLDLVVVAILAVVITYIVGKLLKLDKRHDR